MIENFNTNYRPSGILSCSGTESQVCIITRRINSYHVKDPVSEHEVLATLEKVAETHKNKSFGSFDGDDIKMETWKILLKELDSYDPSKGLGTSPLNSLERYSNMVARTRLYNFHRNETKSVNKRCEETKKNLMNCLSIDYININEEKGAKEYEDPLDNLVIEELKEFIESRLEEKDLVSTFHDCLNGENVSTYYKSKLIKEIRAILIEWYNMHEEN